MYILYNFFSATGLKSKTASRSKNVSYADDVEEEDECMEEEDEVFRPSEGKFSHFNISRVDHESHYS